MLIYLDNALTELKAERAAKRRVFTMDDLYAAIMAGLLPIMWSHGTGAEAMQCIAVPMIGGMVSSTVLTLVVIPALYAAIRGIPPRAKRAAPQQARAE